MHVCLKKKKQIRQTKKRRLKQFEIRDKKILQNNADNST